MNIDFLTREYLRIFEDNQIEESSIDTTKLYFHGSANGNIKELNDPSPSTPLFVTTDIDYANEYLQAAHPNGHAKFDEDENPGKVYLVDIDFNKVKLFDASDASDREKLKNYWPPYILDQLKTKKYSIWSVFKYAIPQIRKFYIDYKRDFNAFSTAIKNDTSFKDEMGKDVFLKGIQFMDKLYGNQFEKIFSSKSEDDALFDIIAIFNKTLEKQGYNAFRNTEVMRAGKKRKSEIKTNDAIGIMSPDCLKDFYPEPLDAEAVKKAIDELHSEPNGKDYKGSNSIVKQIVDKMKN